MTSYHDCFKLSYGKMAEYHDYVDTGPWWDVYDNVFTPTLNSEIWGIKGRVGYGVREVIIEKRKEYKR